MNKYQYLRGSETARETVEFTIPLPDGNTTTCVVDVDHLRCGIKVFPCGNGDDVCLSLEQQLEILEFAQAERKKYAEQFPIKTLTAWHESGIRTFEEFFAPGDKVDEALVDQMMNNLPPHAMGDSYMQAGEAFSHEKGADGVYRPVFSTFQRLGDNCWRFCGYCFSLKTENLYAYPNPMERRIQTIRQKLAANAKIPM